MLLVMYQWRYLLYHIVQKISKDDLNLIVNPIVVNRILKSNLVTQWSELEVAGNLSRLSILVSNMLKNKIQLTINF